MSRNLKCFDHVKHDIGLEGGKVIYGMVPERWGRSGPHQKWTQDIKDTFDMKLHEADRLARNCSLYTCLLIGRFHLMSLSFGSGSSAAFIYSHEQRDNILLHKYQWSFLTQKKLSKYLLKNRSFSHLRDCQGFSAFLLFSAHNSDVVVCKLINSSLVKNVLSAHLMLCIVLYICKTRAWKSEYFIEFCPIIIPRNVFR